MTLKARSAVSLVNAMPGGAQIRFLEHTADVGLAVDADTLPGLFRAAANGLFQLVLGDDYAAPADATLEARRITLQADGAGSLLVAWLRELLYHYESAGRCPVRTDFELLTVNELDATVYCARLTAAPQREIKGVTYHQLSVEPQSDGWHARVIFDV